MTVGDGRCSPGRERCNYSGTMMLGDGRRTARNGRRDRVRRGLGSHFDTCPCEFMMTGAPNFQVFHRGSSSMSWVMK